MTKKLLLIALALLLGNVAPAGLMVSFHLITDNTPGLTVSPDQFTMSLLPVSETQLSLTFDNNGPDAGSVTGIYIEADSLFVYDSMVADGASAAFEQGAAPRNLPGGNPFGFKANPDLTFGSVQPVSHNGLAAGERLQIRFTLLPGITYDNVVRAIIADGTSDPESMPTLRAGLHVQSIGPGAEYSESFLLDSQTAIFTEAGSPIPEPATLFILGVGMLLMQYPRR